jgi:hypothetical protein
MRSASLTYHRVFLVLAAAASLAPRAFAQGCQPISAVPYTISQSGQFCVTADLASSQTSGGAIEVAADNVVLDFQGHTLDGTGAGLRTQADGVHSLNRHDITVRNGHIVAFYVGVHLDITTDSRNHVVENMRFDHARWKAIKLEGFDNVMRGNLVLDTGGAGNHVDGVSACENQMGGSVQAYNNTIINVGVGEDESSPDGMMLYCRDTIAIGNRIVRVGDSGLSIGGGFCKDNILVYTDGRPFDPGYGSGCKLIGSTNSVFP